MNAWQQALAASAELNAGKAAAALRRLDRLARRVDAGWPLLLRARAKMRLGRTRLAVADVTRAFDRDPECGWIFGLPVRAAARPPGREAAALAAAQKKFRDDPHCWPVRAFVGKLKFGAGKPAEGMRHLTWALKRAPKQAYLHAWHAEALRRMGRHKAAETAARRALALDARDGVAYAALAAALRGQKKYAAALAAARQAARRAPAYEVGLLEGARACLALADYPALLRWLERAVRRANRYGWRSLYEKYPYSDDNLDAMLAATARAPRRLRGRALAWRGEALLERGAVDRALPVLEEACRLAPDFAWAHAWRAWALDVFGRRRMARRVLNTALKLDPRYARARLMRAGFTLDAGRARAALADVEAALRQDETWARSHALKARCLAELGRGEAALAAAEEALKLDAEYAQARALRDRLAAKLGRGDLPRWDAAEAAARNDAFEGASRLLGGPKLGLDALFSPSGRHDLLYTLHPHGRPVAAATLAAWRAAAARRGSGAAWAVVGAAEMACGDYAAAEATLGKALRLEPGLSGARLLRAAALLYRVREEGDKRPMAAARAELDAVLAARGDDMRALRLRAEIRNDLEDFAGAQGDLKKMLRLEPDNDWARVELADLYCDYRRFNDAWPLIEALRPRFGGEGWYWALRGRALATTGRRGDGLKALDRAAELAPGDAVIAAWRGEALRVVSRYREALREFDRSLKLEAAFAYSYVWRGRLLLMLGRPAAALRDFEHILRRDRRQNFAPIYRAEALFKLGRYAAAAAALAEAHPHDPRQTWNPRVREGEAPGPREAALFADLDAAAAAHPRSAYVRVIRAGCRLAAGDLAGAEVDYAEALRRRPGLRLARHGRGRAHLAAGRPEQALRDLAGARGGWPAAWAGQALVRLGRHREALEFFDRALGSGDPRFSQVHAWKSEALAALGRAAAARDEAARARDFLGLEQGAAG